MNTKEGRNIFIFVLERGFKSIFKNKHLRQLLCLNTVSHYSFIFKLNVLL